MAAPQFIHNPETGQVKILDRRSGKYRQATPQEINVERAGVPGQVLSAVEGATGVFGIAEAAAQIGGTGRPGISQALTDVNVVSARLGLGASLAGAVLNPASLGLAKGAVELAKRTGRLGVKERTVSAGNTARTLSQRLGGETTASGRMAIRTRQLIEGTPIIGIPFQAASARRLREGGQQLVKFITGSEKAAARAGTPTGLKAELLAGRKTLQKEFDQFDDLVVKNVDDLEANALINDIAAQRPQFLTAKERQLLQTNGAGAEDLVPIRKKLNTALGKTDDFEQQQFLADTIEQIDDLIERSLPKEALSDYAVTRTKWRVQEAALRGEALTKAGTLDAQRFGGNLRRSFGEDFRLGGDVRGSGELNAFLKEAGAAAELAATQAPPFQPGLATVLGVAGAAGGAGIFAGSR